ncbi:MAG: hypothetical protein LV481_00300 [Methylacidiphilales bacterium]|nr:hypothetical protein [Candidatus Methylacidiphilales bacterium]
MPPDNVPAPEGTPKPTPPSASPPQKGPPGKVVVMLSSVAKPAPNSVPPPANAPASVITSLKPGSGQPISGASLTGPIKPPPVPARPPLPAIKAPQPAGSESKIHGNKRTAPIKLNLPKTPTPSSDESIFLTDEPSEASAESHPPGWKELKPGELGALKGDLQSLEVFSRSSSPQDPKAPETKSPEIVKAPETPAPPDPVKPLINLPPVVAVTPPATVVPAVILSSPAPNAPARPPPLPKPKPAAMTGPLLPSIKLAENPVIPILPPSQEKAAPAGDKPLPISVSQAESPPITEVKLPAPAIPDPIHVASSPLKTDAPAARTLPPPLPVQKPVQLLEVPAKPAEPDNRVKPPALPFKDTPPTILPVSPVEVGAEPKPVAALPMEVKAGPASAAPSVLPPIESKTEPRPVTEPEKKPDEPLSVQQPPSTISVVPSVGAKSEPRPSKVTGPILIRDNKPALRPAVLPARLAREREQEKTVTPVEPTETSSKAPSLPTPSPVEAKTPEFEKLKAPVLLPDKLSDAPAASAVPPLVEAKTPEFEKLKAPVLFPDKLSDAPAASAVPPLIETKSDESEKLKAPALLADKLSDAPAASAVPPLVEAKSNESEKLKAPVLFPDKPSDAPVPTVPPFVEAKSAEPEKFKPTVKPEAKSLVAKASPEVSPAKTAEPEKPKSSLRFDSKLAAQPATAKGSTGKKLPDKPVAATTDPALTPRAARARKKRLFSNIFFYTLCLAFGPALYYVGSFFCHETRMEGQVIPPQGLLLGDEAWIVSDFRGEVAAETEELAGFRTSDLQELQADLNHVQRVQADIASREERIRLLQGQIQAAKDEIDSVVKQARDDAQQLWDGPGAQIDKDYEARQQQLSQAIADRAKALKLNYQPDPNFNSPEVWANAYRLALYQVPAGVDGSKELLWLGDQMTQWRDFTKSIDDRKEKIREKVAEVKQSPAGKVSDLQAQVDDLQHRIDSTTSEEVPIKTELQQAQADLAEAQNKEAGLDPSYYSIIDSIPESTIIKRMPLAPNGRFSWRNVEKDTAFTGGETFHHYWLFARAVRPDGRQYWALSHITVDKDSTYQVVIEPEAFTSTKAILRPDLSPDEQQQ